MSRLRTPPPPSWGAEHAMLAKSAERAGWTTKGKTSAKASPPSEESRGITSDDWLGNVNVAGVVPWQEKVDPYGAVIQPHQLRRLARFFVPAAVIETLITEVVEHGQRQTSKYGRGYQVRLRESRRAPTKIEQKKIDAISDEIDTCGVLKDEDERFYRPSFRTYLRKSAYDSLVLDRYLTEVIPDRFGNPAHFLALDASRARYALDKETGYRYPVMIGNLDMRVLAEWKPGDPHRAFIGIRNSVTTLEFNGYGTSELEMAIHVIGAMIRAVEFNVRYLDNGLTGAGILTFHDGTNKSLLRGARNMLSQILMGAQNAGRVALMTTPDGKEPTWTPFTTATMKDMQFAEFFSFFLKVYCALCKIDPIMIGFQFGNEGQKSTLAQGSGKDRLDYGRMKGVWSLVRHLIGNIDRYYVRPKYPDFEIVASGLDTDTEEERNKRDDEALKWLGVNKVLATRDEELVDLEKVTNLADVPTALVPQWTQLQIAKLSQQAQQGPADGGVPDQGERVEGADGESGRDVIDMGRLFDEASGEEDEPVRKSLMAALAQNLASGSTVELRSAA